MSTRTVPTELTPTQLETLKRQARQAIRYRGLSGEIRRAEAALFHVRCTGAGLGFQLAGIAGGAFAPLIALSLLDRFGSMAVAAYVAYALVFVLVAVAAATRVPLREPLAVAR